MNTLEDVFARIYATPASSLHFAAEAPALDRHLHEMQELGAGLESPCDRAFVAGHASDRLGTAFAAGYTEALRALVPETTFAPSAFAVTEAGGGAPSAMQTSLQMAADGSAIVHGEKTFVTLGALAERVYVVASEGVDERGKNRLRLVRVHRDRPGLAWAPGPRLPIVPEVAHARLTLDHVHIAPEDVFSGDAYDGYVKPFRTVEDLHVHAAIVGHLLRIARHFELADTLVADLLGSFVALRGLALESPRAVSTHLALGGALRSFEHLIEAHGRAFEVLPDTVRSGLQRDLALRFVAAKARERRLATAAHTARAGQTSRGEN